MLIEHSMGFSVNILARFRIFHFTGENENGMGSRVPG